jgi:hypothetical protein
MGEVQSKLGDSNAVTGLSYLEDGQFAKIYKVKRLSKLSTRRGFNLEIPMWSPASAIWRAVFLQRFTR